VHTQFNGETSILQYVTVYYKPCERISLEGRNKEITAIDDIIFTRVNDRVTNVTYRANITLNGFRCLFTLFVKSALSELAEIAKKGMLQKSE
jgi:hypothetical protein